MGLRARIAAFFGREKELTDADRFWIDLTAGSRSSTGLPINQMTAMQASTVMACVSLLAEDVAKLPLHIYRRGPKGGKVIATDHPVERLLQRPNRIQNRFEFIETMMFGLLLRGNGYGPIVRNRRGQPIEIWPAGPDRVTIMESPGGQVFYRFDRTGFTESAVLSSLPSMIPAEDMFHLRWIAKDPLKGLSRISLAREAIGLSLAQEQYASRMAGSGAQLSGFLTTTKKIGQEALQRLKEQWDRNYSGLSNTGKTAVLHDGLDWKPKAMTAVDAEFLAQRRFQAEDIAGRVFRIPLHKIGIYAGTGPAAEKADQDYLNNVLSAYLERIEARLDYTFDLARDGVFAWFDASRILRADMFTRYQANRFAIMATFKTPNEVREDEGLPEVAGGDVLLQPTNMMPLGATPPPGGGSPQGSDQSGAPADGGSGDPMKLPPME